MGIFQYVQESLARKFAPKAIQRYDRQMAEARMELGYMEESMSALQLELENLQYKRLSGGYGSDDDIAYTRERVLNIVSLAVQMARKNPITVRSINIQADYVFGQGVSFNAKHPWVQEVIDEFVNYRENRKSLTSHTAMLREEKRQQVYGSLFIVLNTNIQTGRVIVRNVPSTEVHHVICDPQDREKEWYIHRCVYQGNKTLHVYHPAYGVYEMSGVPEPWKLSSDFPQGVIVWSAPVLHVAANRLGDEPFAIPEVYPQLDWALTYKRGLEQWVSIQAAFSRMAMKIVGLKGRKQAAAAKALLQTTVATGNVNETNPPAVAGSTALLGGTADVEPLKTAGAATPPSDADPILNFAGTAVGLPNTFFGDAGKGNFATAKTLDRPTELKMISRQKLWKEIFQDIFDYVVLCSVVAPTGLLRSRGAVPSIQEDVFTGEVIPMLIMPNNDDAQYGEVGIPIDATYDVFFPEILERNVADRVRSLVNAVTQFGKPLTDIVPDKRLVARWLLEALNIPNAQSYIPGFVTMWEQNMSVGEDGKPVEAHIIPPMKIDTGTQGAEDPSQGGAVGNNG